MTVVVSISNVYMIVPRRREKPVDQSFDIITVTLTSSLDSIPSFSGLGTITI